MRQVLAAVMAVCIAAVFVPAHAQRAEGPFAGFDTEKPVAGDAAPRLHAKDTDGAEMDLRDYLGQWVVIEFGSYT